MENKVFEAATVCVCILATGAVYVMSTVQGVSESTTVPGVLRQGSRASAAEINRVKRAQEQHADLYRLVQCIRQVESGGNDKAVGDKGKAVGPLQIWAVTVRDVNRILGEDIYGVEDRWDASKSIEMFMVSSKHYATHYDDWTAEGISRRWNGGPKGHTKPSTVGYWLKVQKLYCSKGVE